jgi:hypothetical protein
MFPQQPGALTDGKVGEKISGWFAQAAIFLTSSFADSSILSRQDSDGLEYIFA